MTGVQDEQNDTEGEQIDAVTLVGLLSDQLGCHIGSGTEDGPEEARAVTSLHRCSKAEVSESDVVLVVKHNIFGLQIAMTDTLGMHEVHDLEHLREVVTASWHVEWLKGNVVEELTTTDELKGHVGNVLL